MAKKKDVICEQPETVGETPCPDEHQESVRVPEPMDYPEAVQEPLYRLEELVGAAIYRFGTYPELVRAALTRCGRDEFSLSEAAKIIDEFKNRKVK